jgi:hypothetical protein
MWATRSHWGDDNNNNYNYGAPKVNIVCHTPSVVSTDYNGRGQGPPPSLPVDNTHSVKTYLTTSTNLKDNRSNVSQSTNTNHQPPRDVCSAASSWTLAPSVSSEQAVREDDITSAKSGRCQPTGKLCSPSISTVPLSAGSECPTCSYVSSVSQSSSTTSRHAPKGDSHGSTTLLDPASNAAGQCVPMSTMCSSTSMSACTAVSTESAPPEGGFPVFGNTKWGVPITAAQYEHSKKKSDCSQEERIRWREQVKQQGI